MKRTLLILLVIIFSIQSFACTTAVISGKFTKDGRPILWKLRDTESFKNKLKYFDEGKYSFLGLINSEDSLGAHVWGGANEVGFSIMNSASFNVNMDGESELKDQEGIFMRKALEECETLNDFEKLLKTTKKPMGLAAHFGVIDAQGGAAFYEVNNHGFTKFDANDAAQSPNGYIIRTNYSFTGKKDVGYGFIRFQTAQDLIYMAESKGDLNVQTILQDFSRSLKHAVLQKDFRKEYEQIPYGENFINSGDFITRHGSASNIVIHGVKDGMEKDMTCVWTQIGFPNTCASMPAWPKGGCRLPEVLTASDKKNAPLNAMSLELKDQCYPIKRSAGYKYLMVSELINSQGTGFIQKLELLEKDIFKLSNKQEENWIINKTTKEEINQFYTKINQMVKDFYLKEFDLNSEDYE